MYTALLAVFFVAAAYLAGLFHPEFMKGTAPPPPGEGYQCCDTGDKGNCHARTDVPTMQYDQHTYWLLKSDIYLHDYNKELTAEHLVPGRPAVINGRKVFVNPSQDRVGKVIHYPDCRPVASGKDRIYGRPDPREPGKPGCYLIPDDIIIYVCRDAEESCFAGKLFATQVKFDVYIRTNQDSEIPEPLKDCYKPELPKDGPRNISFRPSPGGQPNLQLRTFKFVYDKPPVTWLSPYCKPAIYLYPERKTEINVSVFPQGKMLLTIPPYPKTGWDVVAEPNGNIYFQNNRFDYLYYEASLPDQLIAKPNEGYMMSYDERALFLTNLVSKLGLNEKETKQFVDYWVPILPKSPYYFVGIVPQETLREVSPIAISPSPKNLIRVTLYFKPLEQKIPVTPPLILPISRDGYTAVEWGGIFKQDEKHPFSCFM